MKGGRPVYSTYEAYLARGGKLGEADYQAMALKAAAEIDWRTFGRAKNCQEMAQELSACECELTDVLYLDQSAQGIRTENNDGYSITYTNEEDRRQKLENICRRYLSAPVNLLLSGGRCWV